MIIIPDNKHVNKVWIKIINPIERGLFKNNIKKEIIIIEKEKINFVISNQRIV